LSSRTLNYAAGLIRRHLKAVGSRWRKLSNFPEQRHRRVKPGKGSRATS
jgi:hypothetical protein